jgi:small GTP-binding protein
LKNEVNYQITVGLDFFTKIIECGNYLIKLQLWDTAGQERYQSLTSGYLKGVHGCIIVFDVTKRNTFEKIKSWINLFSEFNNYNKNIIIVGNKIDKKNRVISKNEAQNFCFQNNLSYFETSAITGENVFNSFQFLANLIIKSDLFFKNDLVTNKTLNFNSEKDSMCCD